MVERLAEIDCLEMTPVLLLGNLRNRQHAVEDDGGQIGMAHKFHVAEDGKKLRCSVSVDEEVVGAIEDGVVFYIGRFPVRLCPRKRG